MMKKLTILAAAVLALCLLGSCTPKDPGTETTPTETVPTSAPTEATEVPTMPVEEDVVYFANEPEMNRLYSVRRDGTDLKLVLDEQCSSVFQQGENVYYQQSGILYAYHIPTAARAVVVENILDYAVDGEHLVYRVVTDSQLGVTDLRCRDLTTGEDISVFAESWAQFWLGYGQLYYAAYDLETSQNVLCVYDIENRNTTMISDRFYHYNSLIPVEDGAYFEGRADWEEGWYFADLKGTGPVLQEDFLPSYAQLISLSDRGILYLSPDNSYTNEATLHHLAADGTDTVIAHRDAGSSLFCTPAAPDCWIVRSIKSVGWGETNEYGHYNNYASEYEHWLLQADGTLTELNTAGEIGSMFPDGDFPLLDSSTARIPVTSSLYEHFVKNYGYEGTAPICSTTHGAWLNIADGKVDLALLAAPTAEEQAYLEEKGVSVEMKLYGGDGLVFIGNAENPVTDLTHEQILGIYRGEITNWNELGGPDHPIIVYYRDAQSGSQRLFENLVCKGEEVPDFEAISQENPNFWLWDDMGSIVDMILEEPYAIGYSIMTYLDEVYAEEDMMVFTVDGVLPSPGTVKDSSYRYHTQGYLVIRSDEPEDSPARRLFDWFGCPASDDLLRINGVSPLHE